MCSIEECEDDTSSRGMCVKHYTRWLRHGDPFITLRQPPQVNVAEKRCPRCRDTKPIDQFGIRPNGKPRGYCIDCHDRYYQEYVATDHGRQRANAAKKTWTDEKSRDYLLHYKYGINQADYDRMLIEQNGSCAICRTTKSGSRLKVFCVDHCHNTDKVRGLLCTHCNMAIGQMNDDADRLRSAAAYLDRQISA